MKALNVRHKNVPSKHQRKGEENHIQWTIVDSVIIAYYKDSKKFWCQTSLSLFRWSLALNLFALVSFSLRTNSIKIRKSSWFETTTARLTIALSLLPFFSLSLLTLTLLFYTHNTRLIFTLSASVSAFSSRLSMYHIKIQCASEFLLLNYICFRCCIWRLRFAFCVLLFGFCQVRRWSIICVAVCYYYYTFCMYVCVCVRARIRTPVFSCVVWIELYVFILILRVLLRHQYESFAQHQLLSTTDANACGRSFIAVYDNENSVSHQQQYTHTHTFYIYIYYISRMNEENGNIIRILYNASSIQHFGFFFSHIFLFRYCCCCCCLWGVSGATFSWNSPHHCMYERGKQQRQQ